MPFVMNGELLKTTMAVELSTEAVKFEGAPGAVIEYVMKPIIHMHNERKHVLFVQNSPNSSVQIRPVKKNSADISASLNSF